MGRFKRDQQAENSVAAELAAHADSLAARMLEVTVPIYLAAPPAAPTLVGSGVLVTLVEDRFLVTAGHVLDWRDRGQLVVGVSPDIAMVAGTIWTLRAPNAKSAVDDHIDLGIVQLRGGPWDTLPLSGFCSWEELDLDPPFMARHSFGVVGFPVSKNRQPVRGNRIKAHALPVGGLECDASTYVAAGRDPVTNLMIGFDQKAVWGAQGVRTAPALNGVSGGGMWRFGRKLREATRPPLLSAIGTEWHQREHKYILGTRIDVVLAGMVDLLPQIRDFVIGRLELPDGP